MPHPPQFRFPFSPSQTPEQHAPAVVVLHFVPSGRLAEEHVFFTGSQLSLVHGLLSSQSRSNEQMGPVSIETS